MKTKRYVKENAKGGWDVLREGDRRASVQADTQSEAVVRAREVVQNLGGGEIRVMNRAGKIVESDTVARRSSRRAKSK